MFKFVPVIILTMTVALQGAAAAAEQVYRFGIVPQQSASKLAARWAPVLRHLSEQSGFTLRFATAPDIPAFEARLAAGEYAFAYMNPFHYVNYHEVSGYQAMARARDTLLQGIIVVHKDSPVTSLRQLNTGQLAFPAPAAFAATILTQAELRTQEIKFEPRYVSSHDSVYRTVAKRMYMAGGGIMRTLGNLDPQVRRQLRVLWTSKGFTPHAIASAPSVDQDVVNRVRQALVDLASSKEGKELLSGLNITGFIAAEDSDWDDVRTLELGRVDDYRKH